MTRKQDFWTTDEDKKVSAMRAAGETYAQIATVLGKTRNSVLGRADRMGMRRIPWTPERDEKLIELRRAGMLLKDIALILGVTGPACQCRIRLIHPEMLGKPKSLKRFRNHVEINAAPAPSVPWVRCLEGKEAPTYRMVRP
jgi:hypothetical protein